MRLLVTGAGGFLGARVCELARAQGIDVVAWVRPASSHRRTRLAACGAQVVEVDMTDQPAVALHMQQLRPDTVCHLAWSGVANKARHDLQQIHDNIPPTCALLAAAADAGCKTFIGLGSQAEYGARNTIITEQEPAQPTTTYGAAKLAAMTLTQQLSAHHGMRWAWLRLFSVYGPDDNPGWLIPDLIMKLLAGVRPPLTAGTQRWDYLHIDDAAQAVLDVALHPSAQGIFNLGSGEAVAVRDIAQHLRDAINPTLPLGLGEVPFRPDQVMLLQADNTLLRKATGWQPRIALMQGLSETVSWYKDTHHAA